MYRTRIEKINIFLRSQAEPDYVDEILNLQMKENLEKDQSNGDKNELYQRALEIIQSEGKTSTSFYKENYKLDIKRRIIDDGRRKCR